VPDPVKSNDKRCTLEVVRLLPHFEVAYFVGSGFVPNAKVDFEFQSSNEKHRMEEVANSEGILEFAGMPFVSGQSKGTATVKTLGADCSPTVQFDWGR
jgi:hypothetical protein